MTSVFTRDDIKVSVINVCHIPLSHPLPGIDKIPPDPPHIHSNHSLSHSSSLHTTSPYPETNPQSDKKRAPTHLTRKRNSSLPLQAHEHATKRPPNSQPPSDPYSYRPTAQGISPQTPYTAIPFPDTGRPAPSASSAPCSPSHRVRDASSAPAAAT